MNKKIIVNDYTDPDTGLRFVEDDRGNYHCVASFTQGDSKQEITIILENNEELLKENKRLRRILEKLRMDNNWLWEALHTAIRERKKTTAKKAIDNLEKSIREREQ